MIADMFYGLHIDQVSDLSFGDEFAYSGIKGRISEDMTDHAGSVIGFSSPCQLLHLGFVGGQGFFEQQMIPGFQ